MKKLSARFLNFSVNHALWVYALVGLITLAAAAMIPYLQVDTDPENMLPASHPQRAFHNQVKQDFAMHDAIVVGVVPQNGESIYTPKTLAEIKDYSNSAYGSLPLTAFKMFKTHPIFGIGLKNYRVACQKDEFLSEGHLGTGYGVSPWKGHYNQELKKRFEATCSSHPHNLYLTWLAETGFIGFFLFTLFHKI